MPNRPARILTFGRTVVQICPDSVVTILPHGEQVYAMAEDTESYRATARRLGYGEDTARMCREHEVLHSFLAEMLGLHESPTLGRVARDEGSTDVTGLEEEAVMAIQRFCNAAGVDLLAVLTP